MSPDDRAAHTGEIHRATRVILWLDLVLLIGAGSQLNFSPGRTGETFAWLIKVTLTAAFLGIGYWSAVPSLALAVRKRRTWSEVRIVLIAALTLTTVELIVTLHDFSPFFLFKGPGLARTAAWIWVTGYFVLPPLNAWVIFANQRTAAPRPRTGSTMRPWARTVLTGYAVVLTVFGLGMLFFSGTFKSIWPWPVNRLTAGAVSGWMFTLAAPCWWGVRERTWAVFRIVAPFYVLWFTFQLVNVARFSEDLSDGAGPVVYVVALAVSLVVFAAIAWTHERAARAAAPRPTPAAA